MKNSLGQSIWLHVPLRLLYVRLSLLSIQNINIFLLTRFLSYRTGALINVDYFFIFFLPASGSNRLIEHFTAQ
jgi:hypothetical protein